MMNARICHPNFQMPGGINVRLPCRQHSQQLAKTMKIHFTQLTDLQSAKLFVDYALQDSRQKQIIASTVGLSLGNITVAFATFGWDSLIAPIIAKNVGFAAWAAGRTFSTAMPVACVLISHYSTVTIAKVESISPIVPFVRKISLALGRLHMKCRAVMQSTGNAFSSWCLTIVGVLFAKRLRKHGSACWVHGKPWQLELLCSLCLRNWRVWLISRAMTARSLQRSVPGIFSESNVANAPRSTLLWTRLFWRGKKPTSIWKFTSQRNPHADARAGGLPSCDKGGRMLVSLSE
mmetsp:Transcript_12322/g.29940  ORF Transcript_12322/g.29940 Transcript_12322/m.29940 type:complete len:291 (+) Transcript_12322:655-1527(+)